MVGFHIWKCKSISYLDIWIYQGWRGFINKYKYDFLYFFLKCLRKRVEDLYGSILLCYMHVIIVINGPFPKSSSYNFNKNIYFSNTIL